MQNQKVITLDEDVLKILYSRARKYYMRIKRKNNGTGIIEPYINYCNALGIDKNEADKLYVKYLIKNYKDLYELIKNS